MRLCGRPPRSHLRSAYGGTVGRVVEAQHRISTNRLAGSLKEQARLEEVAEAAKPDLPESAHGLHYLLASPFRYGHKSATRFRSANVQMSIFCASEAESTVSARSSVQMPALPMRRQSVRNLPAIRSRGAMWLCLIRRFLHSCSRKCSRHGTCASKMAAGTASPHFRAGAAIGSRLPILVLPRLAKFLLPLLASSG